MRFGNIRKRHVVVASASAAAIVGGLVAYLSLNTEFDLIMPDNAKLYNITLSPDNFSALKQNVGVFTVYQPHTTTHNATSGYCRIAEFIHNHEDGYNDTHVGNSTVYNATAPPAWCSPELNPVVTPEFFHASQAFAAGLILLVLAHCCTRCCRLQ